MAERPPIATYRLMWDRARKAHVSAGNGFEADAAQWSKRAPTKPTLSECFLRGPVPWDWVISAASLPGKALIVGLCLWRLRGAKKQDTVMLANSELGPVGIGRSSKSRALAALEEAGLIRVEHHPGRFPLVTLLLPSQDRHAAQSPLRGGPDSAETIRSSSEGI